MVNYENRMPSEFLVRFLAAIGVNKASLLGHSMGAQVVLHAALHHPEIVEKLVLVDGGKVRFAGEPPPPPMPPDKQRLMSVVTSEETRELLKLLLHDRSLITDRMVDDTLRLHLQSAYAVAKIIEAGPKLNFIDEKEVRTLRPPTLIIWGKEDALTGPAAADRLAAVIPGASRVVIDGGGHMVPWEKPDQFNRAVTEFLRHGAALSSNRE